MVAHRHASASFAAYLQALRDAPAALNSAPLLGHTTLRARCVADLQRAANDEIAAMRPRRRRWTPSLRRVTGTYIRRPRRFRSSRSAARGGAAASATHMRDEQDAVLQSLDETFRIGRELGVPVVVSHHRSAEWGQLIGPLAHRSGHAVPVRADCPRAGSTMLHTPFGWSQGADRAQEPHPGWPAATDDIVRERAG